MAGILGNRRGGHSAATGDNPPEPNTVPSLAGRAAKIAIGACPVAIAIRQRRRRGRPKKPKKPPKWQAHVDSMSPWFAMGLAPVAAALGTDRRGRCDLSWKPNCPVPRATSALVLFCVLASSSHLALMEIYAGLRPGKSQAFLARFRAWIDTHTDQAIIWESLILGFWLIANSINLIVS